MLDSNIFMDFYVDEGDKMRTRVLLMVFAIVMSISVGCTPKAAHSHASNSSSEISTTEPIDNSKYVSSNKILLSEKSITLSKGDTYKLTLHNAIDKNVKWKSSDKKIVSVSKTGVIKAKKSGKAKVTAKYDGKKYTCKVTVKKETDMSETIIYAHIGSDVLSIVPENNSSAKSFIEKLQSGDITVDMHDYGSFEKVGNLGMTLPRNDKDITTQPGDVILYNGNQITIYYDTNNWDFTLLGRIQGKTQSELKNILGDGDVTVVFSLRSK